MNHLATPFSASYPTVQNLLHVGCGMPRPEKLPKYFRQSQWREIRLDIDADVQPDIVADITDLGVIPDHCIDAIWSSHNLEHLSSFQVPYALAEFRRVLRPSGFVLVNVPDLRAIAQHIINDELSMPIYESAAGPITPLDVIFGHQASLRHGNHFMAHRTGFTASTLGQAICEAGFHEARVHEGKNWDLWAIGTLKDTSTTLFKELSELIL